MKPYLLLFLLACLNSTSFAQFKNDEVLYKTIYPEHLCNALRSNPGYLLLDVRSPGEYNDTSQNYSLNIGHLRHAMNIDIRQAGERLDEIAAYKNKPVFVYCSHSQRSRRVSRMLADSGFTNIYNINGGMTAIQLLNEDSCTSRLIESGLSYNIISPEALCRKINGGNLLLLDVRPDSVWEQRSMDQRQNSIGFLEGTIHIALSDLGDHISRLDKSKNIVITDISGYESARAATLLGQNGFKNVSVLVEGMYRWLSHDHRTLECRDIYQPVVDFSIINTFDLAELDSAKDFFFLDIRTNEEFANRHKEEFRNIGQLKNAVHIPSAELVSRWKEIEMQKNKPVIVYAFSGNPEAFTSARILTENGFKDVRVLAGGIFNIRWTAANVRGMQHLNNRVVNVPEGNK